MNQSQGGKGVLRSRFCIINENKPGVLGRITGLLGELNANIEQQVTKSKGETAYEVLDVRCNSPETLRKRISSVEGVISCSIGHFTSDFKTDAEECIIRLCIVHANIPGALGRITRKCASMNLNIISQVNRGKGSIAYTMLDLQVNQLRTNELVERLISSISSMDVVMSCDIDHFQPGSLHRRDTSESVEQDELFYTSDSESVHFDTDSLRSDKCESATTTTTTTTATTTTTTATATATRTATRTARATSPVSSILPANQAEAEQLDWDKDKDKRSVVASNSVKTSPSPSPSPSPKRNYYEGSAEQVTPSSSKSKLMRERSNLTRADKVVFAMVGLPCRGKSFIARKLERFLNWKTRKAKLFNAGKYRRESVETDHSKAGLFQQDNEEGLSVREKAAALAMRDMLQFLQNGGLFGIFDATNSVYSRRADIVKKCCSVARVIFIEVICDDPEILEQNLLVKVRTSPDFAGQSLEAALADLKQRIANYDEAYQPIHEDEGVSYVKLYNLSSKILAHRVYGRFTSSILPYMASLHVGSRPIWLVRSGLLPVHDDLPQRLMSEPSTVDLDSSLDARGMEFAESLALWVKTALWFYDSNTEFEGNTGRKTSIKRSGSASSLEHGEWYGMAGSGDHYPNEHPCGQKKVKVYSSTLKRAYETSQVVAEGISTDIESTSLLNPVNKGKVSGMSHVEIMAKYPQFYQRWNTNKFEERFPGGESYADIISKLEHFVISLEQETQPVLVVSHISCIQILLAYYLNIPVTKSMDIEVPLHTVIELHPTSGGSWKLKQHSLLN